MARTDFDKIAQPFLSEHCVHCHGEKKQKGNLRLDTLPRDFAAPLSASRWADAMERISSGEMPPEDEPKPKVEDAERIVEWIAGQLKDGEAVRMAKRERVTFHKLTREEYANTIRDLLSVSFDATDPTGLPEDPSCMASNGSVRCCRCRPRMWMTCEAPGPSNLPRHGRYDAGRFFTTIKDSATGRQPWQWKLTDEEGVPIRPFLIVDAVQVEGPLRSSWPSPQQQKLFVAGTQDVARAREILTRFSERAFRRPSRTNDIEWLVNLVENEAKTGKPVKGGFGMGFLLEDDFSLQQRQQRAWRLDAVNLDKGNITVTGLSLADNKPDAKHTVFKVHPATRVWKGRCSGALTNLAVGQSLLLNITVATLKGPGRCTDIWLDDESRQLAAAHQTEVHRAYQRAHGLPGWIDSVDNERSLVTVTLFGGFDPALTNDFKLKSRVAALVAEDSLRAYDQINDRMYCDALEIRNIPVTPGSSGLQLVIKPENLLEGFRPRRILRLLAANWPLDDLPWEEMLWPADNRVK